MPPWEKYQQPSAEGPWAKYQNASPQQETQKGNVLGNIVMNRANELADNIVAYRNNDISAPELGLRFIGKAGAGTANELIGTGISEITPEFIKEGLQTSARAISGALQDTSIGDNAGDLLLAARDKYRQFTAQNPRLAANLESGANVAAFVPTMQGLSRGGETLVRAADDVAKRAAPVLNKFENVAAKAPGIIGDTKSGGATVKKAAPLTDDMVRVARRNAYDDVNRLGAGFSDDFANEASFIVRKAKIQPYAGDVLTKQDRLVNRALADYDKMKISTLDDYRRIDSSLGDKAADAYISGRMNEGRIISDVQDRLREMIKPDSINNKYIKGSREGVDALTKDAIPIAAAEFKLRDLIKIRERAMVMDNPTTAIRTGYRNLMLSKRFATYHKDVQKLIVKAADTGVADDLLSVVGSRLNQIAGASIGGVPGLAVSSATAAGARGIRNAMRYRKADKVIKSILEPVRPSIEKYSRAPVAQPPKMLTYQPRDKTVFVNTYGQAIPLTAAEKASLGKYPSTANVLRLAAPDKRAEFSKVWDQINESQRAIVNREIEKAWSLNQQSIVEMVGNSKAAIDDVVAATGSDISNTILRDALIKATNPTMQEVMQMPPAQARAVLEQMKAARQAR